MCIFCSPMAVEPIYKSIGAIIRGKRRGNELPQEALAGRLGISRATLANIETGRQRVLVHQLYALAEALAVKPQDFLPPPHDGVSAGDGAALKIEGDLNPEQRAQVARLIGPIQAATPTSIKETDGNPEKKHNRRSGTKAAR